MLEDEIRFGHGMIMQDCAHPTAASRRTVSPPYALRGGRLRRPIQLSPVDPSLVTWRMSGKMAGRGASMRSRQLEGNEREGRP
jgi:hypothetical protein